MPSSGSKNTDERARGSPNGLSTKSVIFPPLGCDADLHPLGVRRTLYLVTRSSVAFAAESEGFVGSDIVGEGQWVGR